MTALKFLILLLFLIFVHLFWVVHFCRDFNYLDLVDKLGVFFLLLGGGGGVVSSSCYGLTVLTISNALLHHGYSVLVSFCWFAYFLSN